MDHVTTYIELGLRLGRHVDGLVDAYYGPGEIAARIGAEELRDPSLLVRDAEHLADELGDAGFDERRTRWFAAQLTGMETVARRVGGEDIAYADEVERLYGVRPRRVPETVFEAAHRALDEVLPADGSLVSRYSAWREAHALGGSPLRNIFAGLRAELRARTADALGLPGDESVRFEYVRDAPWSAYNYYEGNLRSRVAVNTDLPTPASFAVELVAHETYPGHHTEHAWKEDMLVRRQGHLEETLLMIGTPQSLISEGIAEVGPEVLLGDDLEELAAEQLAREDIAYDATLAHAVKRARRPLAAVPGNAAMMMHEDGATPEDARAYVTRWGLATDERAAQTVRFASDPLWRSYVTTYADGYRLCKDFVGGELDRFRRLLTEQVSPADLPA